MSTRKDYEWLRDRILDVFNSLREEKKTQAHYSYIAWKIREKHKDHIDRVFIPDEIKHEYYRAEHFSKIVQRQCNNLVKEKKLIKYKKGFYPGARYHFRPRTVVYSLLGESS